MYGLREFSQKEKMYDMNILSKSSKLSIKLQSKFHIIFEWIYSTTSAGVK